VHFSARPESVRPLILEALGRTPSPTILYRTAVEGAELTVKEAQVPLTAGSQVVVGLNSVYVDASSQRAPTLPPEAWLFGGDNRGTSGDKNNPPHGCPARAAGTDVVLGIVMAIFARKNVRRERRYVLSSDRA
jgi:hypothetical protein